MARESWDALLLEHDPLLGRDDLDVARRLDLERHVEAQEAVLADEVAVVELGRARVLPGRVPRPRDPFARPFCERRSRE